jgi:hypothetical protein
MNTNASLKKSPLKFFVLVFALSLPIWLIGALAEPPKGLPINLPVSTLMFVCPLIAACILVYREEKLGGISRLLKRVFDYKRIKYKIWYVPIIFLLPLIYLLSYGVMRLLGRPLPEEPYIPFLTIPILFVVFFIGAVGEEVGWFAAILFHDMINVSDFSFPNYGSHYDPAVTGALIAITAVIVTFLWGSKTLARYRYVRVPQSDRQSGGKQ